MQSSGPISIGQARNEVELAGTTHTDENKLEALAKVGDKRTYAWSYWYGRMYMESFETDLIDIWMSVDHNALVWYNIITGQILFHAEHDGRTALQTWENLCTYNNPKIIGAPKSPNKQTVENGATVPRAFANPPEYELYNPINGVYKMPGRGAIAWGPRLLNFEYWPATVTCTMKVTISRSWNWIQQVPEAKNKWWGCYQIHDWPGDSWFWYGIKFHIKVVVS